ILVAPNQPVEATHLPPLPVTTVAPRSGEVATLGEMERDFLDRMLREHDRNIQATARAIGVSRGTLYRKIARYKLAATD
ncbi:MAG TPA: helix-turn-helix domain-containing protein, partial [Kofleriaceae bacterium]